MAFIDSNDIRNCTEIVREELLKINVNVNDEILNMITTDVINISYSKGGDSSDQIIKSFAETYMKEGFYKKFI